MRYTISVAWVIDVDPAEIEGARDSALHKDIMLHARSAAEMMRVKHGDRSFRCVVSDMIITAPETVIMECSHGND